MTHVHSIIFIPEGEIQPISLRIYTDGRLMGASPEGYLVTDAAIIIISPGLYTEFRDIGGNRAEQKKFINQLQQVAAADIQKKIS